VELQFVTQNSQGLRAQTVTIPAGQTQGKLVLEADKNAAPGDRTLSIEARVRFNNASLQVRSDVVVKVLAMEKK
jgi:hypothetical protein